MSRVLLHKLAGWNVLRASASKKLKAWVASRVAETLGRVGSGGSEGRLGHVGRLVGRVERVFGPVVRPDRPIAFMSAA